MVTCLCVGLLSKLQSPPHLIFTTTTVLTDAVVQSPIHQIHGSPKLSDAPSHSKRTGQATSRSTVSSYGRTNSRKSTRFFDSQAREESAMAKPEPILDKTQNRLHSALSSFVEDEKCHGKLDSRVGPSSLRPRLTRAGSRQSSKFRKCRTPGSTTSLKKNVTFRRLNTSITAGIGPHKWEVCPRRSPVRQRRVRSAPASPTGRTGYISTWDCRRNLFSTGEVGGNVRSASYAGVIGGRPPFVVRHIDSKALTKWNFCGEWGCSLPGQTSSRPPSQHFPQRDTDLVEWGEPLRTSSFATNGGTLPEQRL